MQAQEPGDSKASVVKDSSYEPVKEYQGNRPFDQKGRHNDDAASMSSNKFRL